MRFPTGPAAAYVVHVPPPRIERESEAAAPHLLVLAQAREAHARGYDELALALFEQALALDPSLAVAHLGRAASLTRLGRHEDADAALRDLVRSAPDEVDERIRLASLLARVGQDHAALLMLRETIARHPEAADAAMDAPGLAPLRDHPVFLQATGRL